jgi:hypothetical protein
VSLCRETDTPCGSSSADLSTSLHVPVTHSHIVPVLVADPQMKKGMKPQEEDMHSLFATPELAQDVVKLKVSTLATRTVALSPCL